MKRLHLTILSAVMVLLGAVTLSVAVDYVDITTNMAVYVLQEQTDTWTDCHMTLTNGMVIESNAVVGFVSTTNTCYLPVSASHRQENYVGRSGAGTVWASNCLLNVTYAFTIGDDADGFMYLTNTTFIAERDPGVGTFALRLGVHAGGGVGANTGVLEMVNSSYVFNSGSPFCYIYLGNSCHARLTLRNSSIGDASHIYGMLTSGGGGLAPDQAVGWFDASTATVYRCRVGGDPALAYSNGKYTFTNSSLLRMPSGWNGAWAGGPPGLMVGYWGSTDYTSTVTVADSSRVESAYPTLVGYKSNRGNGRLTFTDNSVGVLNDDVSLGSESSSQGYLDVSSGSQVYVTNTLGTASLLVGIAGYGQLSIDGGTCRVDRLYLTNGTDSVLALSSGMLSVKTAVITNDVPLLIGNDTDPARLHQWGGGTTTVHGAMSFTTNSSWRIDADDIVDGVLDVFGALSFAPGVTLSLATTNSTYRFLDGQTIGYADSVTTTPQVVGDASLQVKLETVSTRKALVLRYPKGTTIMVR